VAVHVDPAGPSRRQTEVTRMNSVSSASSTTRTWRRPGHVLVAVHEHPCTATDVAVFTP
jgi:hypothetical protein